MKNVLRATPWLVLLLLSACRSEDIHYSRALFRHIPDEPELLVLVRPNDIAKLAEMAVSQLKFEEFFDERFQIDAAALDRYKGVAEEMMKALGIPWPAVESIGFFLYFQRPILLISGDFTKQSVSGKLLELGFKQNDNGFFDYIYHEQKLNIPEDGLIMLAEETLLDDISYIPEERRLWNRPDFSEYRLTSPLNNSVFVWTHPPDNFLPDFKYRDDLGDLSLAMNFKRNFSLKATIRVKDPEKAVYLYDIFFGVVKLSSGFFGDDEDYGPVFSGIKVTRNQAQVEASLIINHDQLKSLKERFVDDIQNPDSKSFTKFRSFMDGFQ